MFFYFNQFISFFITIFYKGYASVVIQQLLTSTRILGPVMSDILPNWYSYLYDYRNKPIFQINDGGRDMYDGGNKVCFLFYFIQTL